MVGQSGFEPLKPKQRVYSAPVLTTYLPTHINLNESHLTVLPDYTSRIERSLLSCSLGLRRITKMLMDLNQTFQVPLAEEVGLEPTHRITGLTR